MSNVQTYAAPTPDRITPRNHACGVSSGSCPTVRSNTHAASTETTNWKACTLHRTARMRPVTRDGLNTPCGSIRPAFPTLPPTLLGDVCVSVRKGMASQALSLGAFPGAVRRATQRKSRKIVPLLGGQKLGKRCDSPRMAIFDCIGLESATPSKIGQKVGLALDGEALSNAAVALAFSPSHPPAIRGLVVPVIVDAVNEVSGGPVAHVGNERAKIARPSVAHSDAAPAVVLELGVSRVVAAAKHALPDRVQRVRIFERHSGVPFSEHTITKRMGKAK